MPAAIRDFSFFRNVDTGSGTHADPIQLVPGFPWVKQPELPVDHPPPCSAKVKNEWSCNSASPVFFMVWTWTALPL
jgi:hypothetical protein